MGSWGVAVGALGQQGGVAKSAGLGAMADSAACCEQLRSVTGWSVGRGRCRVCVNDTYLFDLVRLIVGKSIEVIKRCMFVSWSAEASLDNVWFEGSWVPSDHYFQ